MGGVQARRENARSTHSAIWAVPSRCQCAGSRHWVTGSKRRICEGSCSIATPSAPCLPSPSQVLCPALPFLSSRGSLLGVPVGLPSVSPILGTRLSWGVCTDQGNFDMWSLLVPAIPSPTQPWSLLGYPQAPSRVLLGVSVDIVCAAMQKKKATQVWLLDLLLPGCPPTSQPAHARGKRGVGGAVVPDLPPLHTTQ